MVSTACAYPNTLSIHVQQPTGSGSQEASLKHVLNMAEGSSCMLAPYIFIVVVLVKNQATCYK